MANYCVNNGDLLTGMCRRSNCLHYCEQSPTNCLQHMYNRPLTLLDVAHLEGRRFPDARRVQRIAEGKIVAWGKIVDAIDCLCPVPFTRMLELIHRNEDSLATAIANDVYLLIAPPMRYLKTELWYPVLRDFHGLMRDANVATVKNKAVWQKLNAYNVL